MVDVPKEFSNFWTCIDPYFRPGHVARYSVDTLSGDKPMHHASMGPRLMPLVYFEEETSWTRRFFIGSVKGVHAELEGGEAVRGSVFLKTYLGTCGLNELEGERGIGTLRAYVNYSQGFPVFGRDQFYYELTTDHYKVGSRLRKAGVACIDIPTSPYPMTVERLVVIMRKYNQDIRARNLDIPMEDPFGLIYNSSIDELDGRIEQALGTHK